jgi:hypothetical protein
MRSAAQASWRLFSNASTAFAGIHAAHPDLGPKPNVLTGGINSSLNARWDWSSDAMGHGTHVSGRGARNGRAAPAPVSQPRGAAH